MQVQRGRIIIMNKIEQDQQFSTQQSKTPTKNHRSTLRDQKTAQKSAIQMLELQYKSVINGYELKFKTMTEQHRRSKQELQQKIMAVCKEKNYYQTIVQSLNTNYQTSRINITNESEKAQTKKLQSIQEQLKRTKEQLQITSKYLKESHALIAKLQDSLENEKRQNINLKQRYNEKEKDINRLHERYNEKEKDINRLHERYNEKEKDINRMHEKQFHEKHKLVSQQTINKYEMRIRTLQSSLFESQRVSKETGIVLQKTNQTIIREKLLNLNAKYKNRY